MFMRFIGGGIGHRATDHLKQSIPEPAPEVSPNIQDDSATDFDEVEYEDPQAGQHS